MSRSRREFDLVVWGATGFTGRLATAYLLGDGAQFHSVALPAGGAAPPGLRWCVAGRNRSKLEALGAPAVVVCDADHAADVDALARRARVIVGFAGPFVQYSDALVAACVRHGTHWIDICGEVAWHRSLLDRFGDRARATHALVVNHCGFDSLPSDLGALFAVNALRSRAADPALRVATVMNYQVGLGGISGGSLATGMAMTSHPVVLSAVVDVDSPFLLGGEPSGGARKEDGPETEAWFDDALQCWVGPFQMADINLKVVRRSNALLGYGPDLSVREVGVCFTEKQARKAAKQAVTPTPPAIIAKMIEAGRLPKPGEGPPPSLRAVSRFQATVIATAEMVGGAEAPLPEDVCVTVSGGECGYEETSKMAIEAGLALIYESATCPGIVAGGGFFTPAAAMGTTLINRLDRAGIRFEVLPGRAAPAAKQSIQAFVARAEAVKRAGQQKPGKAKL